MSDREIKKDIETLWDAIKKNKVKDIADELYENPTDVSPPIDSRVQEDIESFW